MVWHTHLCMAFPKVDVVLTNKHTRVQVFYEYEGVGSVTCLCLCNQKDTRVEDKDYLPLDHVQEKEKKRKTLVRQGKMVSYRKNI